MKSPKNLPRRTRVEKVDLILSIAGGLFLGFSCGAIAGSVIAGATNMSGPDQTILMASLFVVAACIAVSVCVWMHNKNRRFRHLKTDTVISSRIVPQDGTVEYYLWKQDQERNNTWFSL